MKPRLRLVTNVWEGTVAADFTLNQVRQHCYYLGEQLIGQNLTCLLAYDTRFMSNLFAQDIYRYLVMRGVPVSIVPNPVPLPAIQFALDKQQADCGLYISARNRPYWHNGLVLLESAANNLTLTPEEPGATGGEGEADASAADSNLSTQPFPGSGEFVADSTLDVRKPYLDMLGSQVDVGLIRRATLTIFADPMHGTASGYLPAVIGEGSQTKAIEINRETDPLFGKATPLPAENGLSRLRKLVRESDSHIGLAFSADGTALGVVDKNGEQINQFEVVLLLASYMAGQYRQKGTVIMPPPAEGSPMAKAVAAVGSWEDILGFKVELATNTTERISEFLANDQHNLLLGCTPAGEMIMSHYTSYPDALIAGLLMVELVARNGGNLRTLLNDLRENLGV
jgi:phosphomannomutase